LLKPESNFLRLNPSVKLYIVLSLPDLKSTNVVSVRFLWAKISYSGAVFSLNHEVVVFLNRDVWQIEVLSGSGEAEWSCEV
jgi:hypothetical protein